jgi:hypothetical protein
VIRIPRQIWRCRTYAELSATLLSVLDEFKDVKSWNNAVGEKAVYGV